MKMRTVLLGLAVVGIVAAAPLAWAGSAEATKAFEEGKALLAKGQFDKALDAYKTAVKADPESKELTTAYTILRRVISIREQFAKEQEPEAWQQMARALLSYYQRNHIAGESLTLAGQMHEKLKNAESAAILADTQLSADKNEEALKLLTGMTKEQQSPGTTVLQGVALARLGKKDEAKAIAAKIELTKDSDADMNFNAARLYALVGENDKALKALTAALEGTPPTWLADVKNEAKTGKDFVGIAKGDEFTKVLATESKVKSCGESSACGKCPSKGKCSGESKEAGCKDQPKDDAGKKQDEGKKPEKP